MAWPTMSDFNDVVQNPDRCFEDKDLAAGEVAVSPRGLPLVYSGNLLASTKFPAVAENLPCVVYPRGKRPTATL